MQGGAAIMLVVGFCLALSFLMSGMEAGVFALSRLRIRNQMRRGRRAAALLHGYLQAPENFLWTILAGNTLANLVVLAALVLFLHRHLADRPMLFALAFGLAVLLFYALFDLLPKMIFRSYPNRLCLALAGPFRVIHLALWPLVRVLETFSDLTLRVTGGREFKGHVFGNRDELRLVMQESAQHFTSEERAMINRVLDMQNLTVRQVARPLSEVVTVGRDTPLREVLALARERQLTRLLVRENQRVTGYLSLRRLLYEEGLNLDRVAGDYVIPALYVDGELHADAALRRMQKSGQRLAIVLGLDKHEIGMVTAQDILGHIFGEVSL
jgi:putative hemolysin